ncbi:hypothetical protein [Pseudomonas sp. Irchel 3E13]|nr:hypothetical protein [Pseudomonas sp. Irchel 3E13]
MIRKALKDFIQGFTAEFVSAAKAAPAIYFAPLNGAVKEARNQASKGQ